MIESRRNIVKIKKGSVPFFTAIPGGAAYGAIAIAGSINTTSVLGRLLAIIGGLGIDAGINVISVSAAEIPKSCAQ